ncbi:MAG: Crp/Fnr family transcriptional regulator [Gammaproteobacteria bacterium]|nr:Crp/Fnr family transcriptional regulator [Gammaproteobacteria bacterium]
MSRHTFTRDTGKPHTSGDTPVPRNNVKPLTDIPGWLASFPSLASITDTAWLEAVKAAKEFVLPPDTVVIREHQPCRDFLLVASGNVHIFKTAEDGREIMLYRTCHGEVCILTLGTLLEGTDYSANAITENEVHAVAIPAAHFHTAMAESNDFRAFILHDLSRRMRELMGLVGHVAFERLELRLACLLGQLYGQGNTTQIDITHEELARRLGSTRVVVSRLLKEFEHMRRVKLQRGRIELLSSESLAQLSKK